METFMNAKNVHLFDKKAASMDHDHSPGRVPDYGFAFNDSEFSDKLLRIESVVDLKDGKPDVDGNLSLSNGAGNENRHREGDEDADNDGARKADGLKVQQVTTLHISSTILAAKSPFFSKLFSNLMMESEQKSVSLRINASEEAALLELLKFMYSNKLSVFTPIAVLGVLMAADKFEVVSCTRYCSHILRSFPMTPQSSLLYLGLPRSVLMNEAVQPLTDAAKQFLAASYKDIAKSQNEVMELPLAGIVAILASDDLQVAYEDVVYDLTLKWARTHYPKLEERQEILSSRLAPLIRFPLMSCRKLRKVLTCNDFNTELVSKLVLEALFFKSEPLYHQRNQTPGDAESTRRFVDRAYKYRPVKVIELELPQPQCVVYMDLKRKECKALFPSGRVYSQSFHLRGHSFFLSAHCNTDPQNSIHCFGLFLGMQEKGSVSLAVDYVFSARSKPTEEFVAKYKGTHTFSSEKAVGYRNLLGISWSSFVADESQYFINDNLHLRAELTMNSQVLHINPEMS